MSNRIFSLVYDKTAMATKLATNQNPEGLRWVCEKVGQVSGTTSPSKILPCHNLDIAAVLLGTVYFLLGERQ